MAAKVVVKKEMIDMTAQLNGVDPYRILNIDAIHASDETIHQAYLEAVRQYPPDKEPEHFQRIRDAYEMIKTCEDRTKINLFGMEAFQSLSDVLPDGAKRLRSGSEMWISMIETEAKRTKDKPE